MPHYKIILKLENKPRQDYLRELPDKDIDAVYAQFERRVHEMYGAGRIEYFNCVMVASQTLPKIPERHQVKFTGDNLCGLEDPGPGLKWSGKIRRSYQDKPTLGERGKE